MWRMLRHELAWNYQGTILASEGTLSMYTVYGAIVLNSVTEPRAHPLQCTHFLYNYHTTYTSANFSNSPWQKTITKY